ncbi:MAG TPA: hypothetical protein VE594_05155 [Nitrososphaeraceae archaeon]|nr:hypothetical protein [Nitrososphaeraceae archaeon]
MQGSVQIQIAIIEATNTIHHFIQGLQEIPLTDLANYVSAKSIYDIESNTEISN